MRIFVAGASGAIGSRLVPQLIERGHEVIGTSTSRESAERVRSLGAEAITLDLLDSRAVREAVLETEPDAIVHQATALGDQHFSRNFDRIFAQTNRLRTEGTDALLAAARDAGVQPFVAQSFASPRYARVGGPVKTEDDPLDPTPVPAMRETTAALRYLDQAVTDAGGIALRYGGFYGAANDGMVEPVRKRRFPIVGDGGGVSSLAALRLGIAGLVGVGGAHDALLSVRLVRRANLSALACSRARTLSKLRHSSARLLQGRVCVSAQATESSNTTSGGSHGQRRSSTPTTER